MSQSEIFKSKGNQAYIEHKWHDAIKHYSEAIRIDPTVATFYSNRAASYIKTHDWQAGLDDCIAGLNCNVSGMSPSNVAKLYWRKGHCQWKLGDSEGAELSYLEGLHHDPENAILKKELSSLEKDSGRFDVRVVDELPEKYAERTESLAEHADPKKRSFVAPKELTIYTLTQLMRSPSKNDAYRYVFYNLNIEQLVKTNPDGLDHDLVEFLLDAYIFTGTTETSTEQQTWPQTAQRLLQWLPKSSRFSIAKVFVSGAKFERVTDLAKHHGLAIPPQWT